MNSKEEITRVCIKPERLSSHDISPSTLNHHLFPHPMPPPPYQPPKPFRPHSPTRPTRRLSHVQPSPPNLCPRTYSRPLPRNDTPPRPLYRGRAARSAAAGARTSTPMSANRAVWAPGAHPPRSRRGGVG